MFLFRLFSFPLLLQWVWTKLTGTPDHNKSRLVDLIFNLSIYPSCWERPPPSILFMFLYNRLVLIRTPTPTSLLSWKCFSEGFSFKCQYRWFGIIDIAFCFAKNPRRDHLVKVVGFFQLNTAGRFCWKAIIVFSKRYGKFWRVVFT